MYCPAELGDAFDNGFFRYRQVRMVLSVLRGAAGTVLKGDSSAVQRSKGFEYRKTVEIFALRIQFPSDYKRRNDGLFDVRLGLFQGLRG
jgi:hypothetical protein